MLLESERTSIIIKLATIYKFEVTLSHAPRKSSTIRTPLKSVHTGVQSNVN